MLGVVIDGIEQQQVHFFQGVRNIPLDQHGQILGFQGSALPLLLQRGIEQIKPEGNGQQYHHQPADNEAAGQCGCGKRGKPAGHGWHRPGLAARFPERRLAACPARAKRSDFQTGPPGRVVVRASEQGHENHGLCHRKSSRAPILAGEPGDDHAPPAIGQAASCWLAA